METSLTVVGTATTLLRLGRFRLLTDPNFLHRGRRARLGWGLSSRRRTDPALTIPELAAVRDRVDGIDVRSRSLREQVRVVAPGEAVGLTPSTGRAAVPGSGLHTG